MTEAERLERPSVPVMDAELGRKRKVLDHGFIRLIDYMGDEAAITQAARVSYGKGTKSVNEDRGLIRYLMKHWHTTPFEMCEIKMHVKLPVFVARQWIRHRTANVNEASARYSIMANEFYIPDDVNIALQSKMNKQGRDGIADHQTCLDFTHWLQEGSEVAYETYEHFTSEGVDVARELARMGLSMNIYTEWYWKVDLHNLLHFLRLRADPHAQWEIRQYADVICSFVQLWLPNVWYAFVDYRLEAHTFSREEMEVIRAFAPELGVRRPEGSSDREYLEFQKALGIDCEDR